jgi:hypothetical protein
MGPSESWLGQRRRVRGCARLADSYRREASRLRSGMRDRIARIGEPQLVTWAFVAGLVWASARPRASRGTGNGRTLARLAGGLLWGWKFAHRVRATGMALGLASPGPAPGGGNGRG